MGLTPDEQKLLDELNKKLTEDDADDYEVEIFSGEHGARIPMSKAKGWLEKTFGITDTPAAPPGAGQGGQGGDPGGQGDQGDPKGPTSLFRPRKAGQGGSR